MCRYRRFIQRVYSSTLPGVLCLCLFYSSGCGDPAHHRVQYDGYFLGHDRDGLVAIQANTGKRAVLYSAYNKEDGDFRTFLSPCYAAKTRRIYFIDKYAAAVCALRCGDEKPEVMYTLAKNETWSNTWRPSLVLSAKEDTLYIAVHAQESESKQTRQTLVSLDARTGRRLHAVVLQAPTPSNRIVWGGRAVTGKSGALILPVYASERRNYVLAEVDPRNGATRLSDIVVNGGYCFSRNGKRLARRFQNSESDKTTQLQILAWPKGTVLHAVAERLLPGRMTEFGCFVDEDRLAVYMETGPGTRPRSVGVVTLSCSDPRERRRIKHRIQGFIRVNELPCFPATTPQE